MLTPGTAQPDRRSQGLGQVSESSKSSNCSLRRRRKVSSAIQCYCGELLYARKHQSQHVRDRNTQRLPPPSPRSCQPSPIPSGCLTLLPGVMSNESGRFKWTLRHRNKASRIFMVDCNENSICERGSGAQQLANHRSDSDSAPYEGNPSARGMELPTAPKT